MISWCIPQLQACDASHELYRHHDFFFFCICEPRFCSQNIGSRDLVGWWWWRPQHVSGCCVPPAAQPEKRNNRFFCWWKELLVVKKVSISEWEKDRNFGWMDIKNGRSNIHPTWRHAWTHPKEGMDSLQPLWNPFEDGSKPFTVHITFGNVGRKGFAQPQALQGARVLPWELAVQVWKKSYRPIWKY